MGGFLDTAQLMRLWACAVGAFASRLLYILSFIFQSKVLGASFIQVPHTVLYLLVIYCTLKVWHENIKVRGEFSSWQLYFHNRDTVRLFQFFHIFLYKKFKLNMNLAKQYPKCCLSADSFCATILVVQFWCFILDVRGSFTLGVDHILVNSWKFVNGRWVNDIYLSWLVHVRYHVRRQEIPASPQIDSRILFQNPFDPIFSIFDGNSGWGMGINENS